MGIVCKNLGWGDRWLAMNPNERSEGLLMRWDRNVTIYEIKHNSFSIKVDFESANSKGRLWGIFVYASNKERVREGQQEELLARRDNQGSRWIMGGTLMTLEMLMRKQEREEDLMLVVNVFNNLLR